MSSSKANKGKVKEVRTAPSPSEDSNRSKKPRVKGNEDQAKTPSLPPTVDALKMHLKVDVKFNHKKYHQMIAGWFEAVKSADMSSQEKNEMTTLLLEEHEKLYISRKKYAEQLIQDMFPGRVAISGQEGKEAKAKGDATYKNRRNSLRDGLKENMLAILDWELAHTQKEGTKKEIHKLFNGILAAGVKFRPEHYIPELEERMQDLESKEAGRLIFYCDLLEGKRGDKDGGWKERRNHQYRPYPDYRKTLPNVIQSLIDKSFPQPEEEGGSERKRKEFYEQRLADCNLSEAEERVIQDQEKLIHSVTRDSKRKELLKAPGGQDAINKVRAKWMQKLPKKERGSETEASASASSRKSPDAQTPALNAQYPEASSQWSLPEVPPASDTEDVFKLFTTLEDE